MIKAVPSSEIHPEKWNQCILHSSPSNVFLLYQNLNAACEKWTGLVYNDYEAVMALPLKKKLGFSYSWQPQFTSPYGVVGKNAQTLLADFMIQATCHTLWIKLFTYQETHAAGARCSKRKNQILVTEGKDIQTIRSAYSENTRRNIKKAHKSSLQLLHNGSTLDLVSFFKREKGKELDNLNEASYTHLLALLNSLYDQDALEIVSVTNAGGEILAMAGLVKWNGRCLYYKGAVNAQGKTCGAMHFLMDHAIQDATDLHQVFDFGGSNVDSVARFYKGFGAEDEYYFYTEWKKLNFL